jgi:FSR family fosmidomycin resistance protein-like MFS transporter
MASLAAVAAARSATVLLVAFVAFFPASGAFVSLTQAALMDRAHGRQQQRMAAWNLAGSAGAVGGPLLLAGVLAVGGSWRSAYLLLAAAVGAALAVAALAAPSRQPVPLDPEPAAGADSAGVESTGLESAGVESAAVESAGADVQSAGVQSAAVGAGESADSDADPDSTGAGNGARRTSVREALSALRQRDVARWAVLLEISDLLLDVLTGYIGIYLVDVVGASPAEAAVGVAVRLGAGLAGDAMFVVVSRRVSGPAALRVSAIAACALYPAFLLIGWLPAKLVILAVLSMATACWYPVVQAGLYTSLPGRSGIAVFLSSAAGLVGAAGPLAVGFIAQQAGLSWALGVLAAAPAAVLAVLPGAPWRRVRKVKR